MLVAAYSSQPAESIGDGNTEPDIVGADIGTEDYTVLVRSERGGTLREPRTYTLVYVAEDSSGNQTEGRVEIRCGHDRRRRW